MSRKLNSRLDRRLFLETCAQAMRKQPTRSEVAFWRLVSAKRLGVAFRRQFVVGEAIVDFAAPSGKLAVEIDGPYHAGQARADARRERKLRLLGWRVLRLSEQAVLCRPEEVRELVMEALGELS